MAREIKNSIREFFIIHEQEDPLFYRDLISAWKEVTSQKIFENSSIFKIENGTLFIKTNSPSYRNEITLKKMQFVRKINKLLNKNKIRKIQVT